MYFCSLHNFILSTITTTAAAAATASTKRWSLLFLLCSFGWVYQANTGVFLTGSQITPSDVPLTFSHPSCTSSTGGAVPCDHKTKTYDHKNYLVLGTERSSSDSDFPLDVNFDFIGRPKTQKFCGNTICMNAVSYYQTLSQSGTGVIFPHVRSLRIDTTTVPEYNEVDLDSFEDTRRDIPHNGAVLKGRQRSVYTQGKRMHSKHKRGQKKSKEKVHFTANKRSDSESVPGSMVCTPNSDRIEIDELRRFESGSSKKVYIRTGEGKDIFSIGGLIGEPDDDRTDILDADLGGAEDEANVFSIGYLLDKDRGRADLIAGVKFDNTAGEGRVCYLKRDLVTWRCVGKVKRVNIFKGSR